jgi:hypothetical protein
MQHIDFDVARPQPAGRPYAVAAGLKADRNPADLAPGPLRFVPPALQQPEQLDLVGFELFGRMPLDPRDDPGNQPARLAHLLSRAIRWSIPLSIDPVARGLSSVRGRRWAAT